MARFSKKTTSSKKVSSSSNKRTKPSRTNNSAHKRKANDDVRLNRFLSLSGVCSRRKADEYIEEGLVKVNGKTVFEMGLKVNPAVDRILFKGKPIKPVSRHTYLVMYKPRNVLTTLSDPLDRPTIKDMIPKKYKKENLFPIGRLDWLSEGLLIMTNDGDYAQNILHPKKNVPKTYEVKLEGKVPERQLDKLVKGVTIPGGKAHAVKVDVIKKSTTGSHTWIRITVVEGRNRLIRKMMEKIGCSVMRLRRISIGNLKVSHLKSGEWAELSEEKKELVFVMPSTLKGLI